MSAFFDILSGKKNIFEVLISQKKRDEIKTNLYVAGIAKELPKSVQKRIDEERKQIVYKGEEREGRTPKREPIVRHDDVNDTDVVEKIINNKMLGYTPTAININIGRDLANREKIHYTPNDTTKTFNLLYGVIGATGAGKTQYLKSHLYQFSKKSKVGTLVFDYKADYSKDDFVSKANVKVVRPYLMNFNPLTVFGDLPRQPIQTANLFVSTMQKVYGLGNVQVGTLKNIIKECYENKGIYSDNDSTWSLTAPTVQDVRDALFEREDMKYDSLAIALDTMVDMAFFNPKGEEAKETMFDFIQGITVISLSSYEKTSQNLIVGLMLDIFATQMHLCGKSDIVDGIRGINKMILVDEARNIMPQKFESLMKIMLEGREFGVGVILGTQELGHFKDGEYDTVIQNWVVMNSNPETRDIVNIFGVDNKTANGIKQDISSLEVHTCFTIDSTRNYRKMKTNAFYRLEG